MTKQTLALVYDKDCPACRNYARLVRIRKDLGDLKLVNARETNHPLVQETKKRNLDLDEGFVFVVDEEFYYGPEAIHHLAIMSTKSGFFNKFNHWIFRSKTRSKICYPFLKFGRNLLLKILRIKKIKPSS